MSAQTFYHIIRHFLNYSKHPGRRNTTYMYEPRVCLQGLNTLKYVIDADDEMFDIEGGLETPILSLVGGAYHIEKKIIMNFTL